jgi:predicted transcriptional regulator
MDKTTFQLVLEVMDLGNVLHTATENAIPNHKANGNRNSKNRGRAPWNEEIGQASRRTKQAFHRWKMDAHQKNLVMHYIRKCERIKENTQTKTTTSDSKNLQTLINNFSISSSENREQHDQTKPTPSSSTIWY